MDLLGVTFQALDLDLGTKHLKFAGSAATHLLSVMNE